MTQLLASTQYEVVAVFRTEADESQLAALGAIPFRGDVRSALPPACRCCKALLTTPC